MPTFFVVLAAKSFFIFPIRIATVPVNATALERLPLSVRLPDRLFRLIQFPADGTSERNGYAITRFVGATHGNEIAHAAFDNLHFDRRHPAAFVAAILTVAV